MGLNGPIDLLLHGQLLRHAFLDPSRSGDRLRDFRMKAQAPLCGHRRLIQPWQRAAGIGQHLTNFTLSLRIRIKDAHVPPIEQETRGPAAADNPTADDCRDLCHAKPLSHNIQFRKISCPPEPASPAPAFRAPLPDQSPAHQDFQSG